MVVLTSYLMSLWVSGGSCSRCVSNRGTPVHVYWPPLGNDIFALAEREGWSYIKYTLGVFAPSTIQQCPGLLRTWYEKWMLKLKKKSSWVKKYPACTVKEFSCTDQLVLKICVRHYLFRLRIACCHGDIWGSIQARHDSEYWSSDIVGSSRPFCSMQREEAVALVRDAIAAGIFNDLVSLWCTVHAETC